MKIENIFELENFLNKKKLINYDNNSLEYKEYLREFGIYTHIYNNNNNYFNEFTDCVFNKCLVFTGKLPEKMMLENIYVFLKEIKNTNNLIFDEKIIFAQLLSNIILHSFDLSTPISREESLLSINLKKHQYETIEFIKEKLTNFQLFYLNKICIDVKETVYKSFIWNVLKVLSFFGFLIIIKKKKMNNISTFFRPKEIINLPYNLNVYFIEPKIKEYNGVFYFTGNHYFSFKLIFKKNSKSNFSFNLKDFEFLEKIKTLKYYIIWDFYYKVEKIIAKSLDCTLENLENFITTNYLKELKNWKNNENKINQYYIYLQFLQIKKQLKTVGFFYLASFFDFRGRVYSYSPISPMGSKIFRYLYFYGYYSDLDSFEKTNINSEELKIISENIIFKKLIKVNKNITTWFYWFMLEIGKIFKNELLEKKEGKLNMVDFFTLANEKLELYFNNNLSLNFEEEIELSYFIYCLNDSNNTHLKKLLLFKDSTASGIQLLSIILGVKNPNLLKVCNLDSNEFWYDTYFYIINMFKNSFKSKSKLFLKYFTRKYLKKIIMTYNYSIGEDLAMKYFLDSVEKKHKKSKILKESFILFFKFLRKFFEGGNFFKEKSIKLIKNLKDCLKINKKLRIELPDNSYTFLHYNVSQKITIDRYIYKKRVTIVFNELLDEIDEDKTFVALKANLIHSYDATFARRINNLTFPMITIHDCFGVDVLNCSRIISAANKAINDLAKEQKLIFFNLEKYNYNSKFILL